MKGIIWGVNRNGHLTGFGKGVNTYRGEFLRRNVVRGFFGDTPHRVAILVTQSELPEQTKLIGWRRNLSFF